MNTNRPKPYKPSTKMIDIDNTECLRDTMDEVDALTDVYGVSAGFSRWVVMRAGAGRTDVRPNMSNVDIYIRSFLGLKMMNFPACDVDSARRLVQQVDWLHWRERLDDNCEYGGYLYKGEDDRMYNPVMYKGGAHEVIVPVCMTEPRASIHTHPYHTSADTVGEAVRLYGPSVPDLEAAVGQGWQVIVSPYGLFLVKVAADATQFVEALRRFDNCVCRYESSYYGGLGVEFAFVGWKILG